MNNIWENPSNFGDQVLMGSSLTYINNTITDLVYEESVAIPANVEVNTSELNWLPGHLGDSLENLISKDEVNMNEWLEQLAANNNLDNISNGNTKEAAREACREAAREATPDKHLVSPEFSQEEKKAKRCKMTAEEAHVKGLERDRVRQGKIRAKNALTKKLSLGNVSKLKRMIKRKEDYILQLEVAGKDLKADLVRFEVENQATVKLIKDKEKAEVVVKEKYKLVFKHHSACRKK